MNYGSLYIILAATSFSLLAPLSTIAEQNNIDPNIVSFYGFVTATFIFGIFVHLRKLNTNICFSLCFSNKNIRTLLIVRAICGLNLILLLYGFSYVQNKYVGILIAELYPILAVIISSIFFTKNPITLRIKFLITLSFLAVISTPLHSAFTSQSSINSEEVFPYIIIFVGTVLSAISSITEPEITKRIHLQHNIANLDAALSSKFVTNILTSVLVLISFFYFPNTSETQHTFSYLTLLLILLFALFIDVIPGILSRIAGIYINNNSIYSLWSLTPVFSFIIVSFITGDSFSIPMIMSAFIIITTNAFISFQN